MSTPDLKAVLADEIRAAGDASTRKTTDAILLSVLDTYWLMWASKGAISPVLQYLYAKRQVIDFWMVSAFRDHDFSESGVSESLGQMSRNLQAIRDTIDDGKGGGMIPQLEQQLTQQAGSYAVDDISLPTKFAPETDYYPPTQAQRIDRTVGLNRRPY